MAVQTGGGGASPSINLRVHFTLLPSGGALWEESQEYKVFTEAPRLSPGAPTETHSPFARPHCTSPAHTYTSIDGTQPVLTHCLLVGLEGSAGHAKEASRRRSEGCGRCPGGGPPGGGPPGGGPPGGGPPGELPGRVGAGLEGDCGRDRKEDHHVSIFFSRTSSTLLQKKRSPGSQVCPLPLSSPKLETSPGCECRCCWRGSSRRLELTPLPGPSWAWLDCSLTASRPPSQPQPW